MFNKKLNISINNGELGISLYGYINFKINSFYHTPKSSHHSLF